MNDSIAMQKKTRPPKFFDSDTSHDSTIMKEPTRRILRSLRNNTTEDSMEKEPSRICLRNRTVSRTSGLETSSNNQNPQCKAKISSVKTTTKNQDKPSSNKDNSQRETRSSTKSKKV